MSSRASSPRPLSTSEAQDEKQRVNHDISSANTIAETTEPSTAAVEDPEKHPDGVATPAVADAAEDDHEYITGMKLFLVMSSITLVCFLMLLDTSIISTAIPRITSDFNSLTDVGWYGSAYLLANCAVQPLTGKIYSNFSSRYTFLAFLGIFELGSALCGAATSSIMLIIGRAIAGLGASGLVNGALTIIAAVVPMHKRPAMMGILMGIGQMGLVGGPLIGGAFTQYTTWRWCFYVNLPIGGVGAIFLLLIKIPDRIDRSPSRPSFKTILGKLDLFGFVLFAPFAIMFILPLQWGGVKYAWNSATIIGLFCGSAGMLIIFMAWEYRVGDGAMIPFFMIKKRVVWSSCLVMGCFFGSLLTVTYYLPIYFQAVKGVSPSLSGVYVLPSILSQLLMAVLGGFLVGKVGYYLPFMVTSGAITCVGVGLMSTYDIDTSTARWVGYQFLAGIGRGIGFQMPIVAIQNTLLPTQIPVGMSTLVFSQTFGGTLFLAFAQTVFSHSLIDGLKEFAPTVNAQAVINAGATAVRTVVSGADLHGVLQAYSKAVDHDFYLGTGSAAAVFVFAWGMGWKDIRKKKAVTPEA